MFKIFALLESVWNLLQNPYNTPPHLRHVATLPWEIKNSNFLQMWKKSVKRLRLICGTGNSSHHGDVTAVLVNNQHGIQRRRRDFKKVCIWRGTQHRGWQANFLRKAGQSMVLTSCWKSCATQAQFTGGQSAADCAVLALKKTLRLLMI